MTATIVLLIILGVGAVGGGLGLALGGAGMRPPDSYLDDLPLISNWVIPGLILVVGFGVGSLVAAYGIARRPRWAILGVIERLTRHHWSWITTIVIGGAQVIWIGIEVVSIPFSVLMPTFGLIGMALLALPLTTSVRSYLAQR